MSDSGRPIKRWGALLLLGLLVLGGSSRLEILAYYRLNHRYIATQLCVNRDRPAMHCNGKCFLHHELSRDAGRNRIPGETPGSRQELSGFLTSTVPLMPPPQAGPKLSYRSLLLKGYTAPKASLFHPPAC